MAKVYMFNTTDLDTKIYVNGSKNSYRIPGTGKADGFSPYSMSGERADSDKQELDFLIRNQLKIETDDYIRFYDLDLNLPHVSVEDDLILYLFRNSMMLFNTRGFQLSLPISNNK